ncbi:MAG: NAD(P)-dependent oxidoreductase [Candidatus Levybacteria bacterium]|nr:NAD(P)-dependent oxidoreductase [Candidatus Levybacteria bacterium]
MKILGTGLSGLVGSRIIELLNGKYQFESSDIDITDQASITKKIKESDASIVLHLAAKTDVDGCEKDKPLGENGDAWKINVLGTKNIAAACQDNRKKMIYISTDFVFDGSSASAYSEEDSPNPINWYAKTKYEGEKIVQSLSTPWVVVRLAYPYRAEYQRPDFFRAILNRLQNNQPVKAVADYIFTPTFIDDVPLAIDKLVESQSTGIYHVVGSQILSPYMAGLLIAKNFTLDVSLVTETTTEEYFKNRATRPLYLGIKNDKIEKLGVKMKTFEEGLEEIKRQLNI